MITREQLKENAKTILSKTYWMSLVDCFLVSAVTSSITSAVYVALYFLNILLGFLFTVPVGLITRDEIATIIAGMLSPGFLIMYAGIIALQIFVTYPCQIGMHCFFIKSRNTLNPDLGDTITPIKTNYKNTVKTTFHMVIKIWLWSLLFVIPGIIKALEYSMVTFIVAENPDIDYKRALEISSKTMDGEKSFAFVLGLSFIGWILLAVCTCGVGAPFLTPYIEATFTEYYMYLKTKALNLGYADAGDFAHIAESSEATL